MPVRQLGQCCVCKCSNPTCWEMEKVVTLLVVGAGHCRGAPIQPTPFAGLQGRILVFLLVCFRNCGIWETRVTVSKALG